MEGRINKIIKHLFAVIAIVMMANVGYAITYSSNFGQWSNANTWNNSGPACGDTIYISAGHQVTVDIMVDFSACPTPMFLVVEGTLKFNSGKKIDLPAGSGVLVKTGGEILGGGGKGSSNLISIGGVDVWKREEGDILDPTFLGTPFYEDIISVVSGSWNQATTWSCSCDPLFYHSVTVDTAHSVSIAANSEVQGLTIYGTLDASAFSGTLTINGNWNNAGIFLEGNSLIRLQGTTAQQVSGINNFYSLTIANGAGVSFSSGSVNLLGTLTLDTGNLATNNLLTLVSNASGTGNIATITNGSITGSVNVQRYIAAGATNWRFLTSPIAGATLADLNDDFVTSGFNGADFPLWPTAAAPWASIYYYDETQPGIQDSGFVAATDIGNAIAAGEGIWVWCGDTITGTQPFTIDAMGSINSGNINLPLSYTNTGFPSDDGWNMVGNPYPSTLDWDSPNITKTGINNAIYIWNPNLQQFASYVFGIGTNGGSNNIASSQAFWLQANSAAASVQVTEASKTNVDGTFLKPISGVNPLTIDVQNGSGTDQTIINFEENATNGFDGGFDAHKMVSVNPNLPNVSSLLYNGGTEYSINQLPKQEINILIKITTGVSGLHNVDFSGINNFDDHSCLLLEDLFTGTIYDLNVTPSFTTFIFDTTATPRYLLKFGAPTETTVVDVSCFGNSDGSIKFEKYTSNTFDVIWKDGSGSVISNSTNIVNVDSTLNLVADAYTIEFTDSTCGNVIDTVVVTQPAQIIADFTASVDTVLLSTGGNVNFNNLSSNALTYLWDFDDGNNSSLVSPTHQFTQIGNYLVTLYAYQSPTCFESYVKSITVVDPAVITAIGSKNGHETDKLWIKDHVLYLSTQNTSDVRIRNVLGQELISSSVENIKSINLSHLDAQTLIVELFNGNEYIDTHKVSYIK